MSQFQYQYPSERWNLLMSGLWLFIFQIKGTRPQLLTIVTCSSCGVLDWMIVYTVLFNISLEYISSKWGCHWAVKIDAFALHLWPLNRDESWSCHTFLWYQPKAHTVDTNLNPLGEIINYIYLKEWQNTFILYTFGKILGLRIR